MESGFVQVRGGVVKDGSLHRRKGRRVDEQEQRRRLAAFAHVERLSADYGGLTGRQLDLGFRFDGEYIPLVLMMQGIGKPARMQYLLSLRTAWPRKGAIYADQEIAHAQILSGSEEIVYDFMRGGPDRAPNRWLREAWELQLPVIYFLAVAQAFYQAFMPVWVVDWDPTAGEYGQVRLAFGLLGGERPLLARERRAGLRVVQTQLRRANFRERVVSAYGQRCAISGAGGKHPSERERTRRLLGVLDLGGGAAPSDAASEGLLLTKLHRAAFEAGMIGIDADYRVRASRRLLAESSVPFHTALQELDGAQLQLPRRPEDRPNRDLLALRYREFVNAD